MLGVVVGGEIFTENLCPARNKLLRHGPWGLKPQALGRVGGGQTRKWGSRPHPPTLACSVFVWPFSYLLRKGEGGAAPGAGLADPRLRRTPGIPTWGLLRAGLPGAPGSWRSGGLGGLGGRSGWLGAPFCLFSFAYRKD